MSVKFWVGLKESVQIFSSVYCYFINYQNDVWYLKNNYFSISVKGNG